MYWLLKAPKIVAPQAFETLWTTYPMIQFHIPEDMNPDPVMRSSNLAPETNFSNILYTI
jgi:hypothetical protein